MTQAICDITTDEVNVDVVVEPQADTMVEVANRAGGMEQVFHDNTLIGNGNSIDLGVNTDLIATKEYVDEKVESIDTYTKDQIDGKLTAVDAQIDANADAIQKTREDFTAADQAIRDDMNAEDGRLQSQITAHASAITTNKNDIDELGDQVAEIESKIPESASATNQLVTKEDLKSIDLEGYATTDYVDTIEQEIRADMNEKDSQLESIINEHAESITTIKTDLGDLGEQVANIESKIPDGTSDTNPLINKQQLLDEEMDIREDLNSGLSELQTQITAQAAEIAGKQDELIAGDNIVISGNTISATGAGGGAGFDVQVVQELPATGQKGIIYLLAKDGTAPDVYDEYVWITATQTFELIGTTQVDLTDYAKKEELNNYLPLSGGEMTGLLKLNGIEKTLTSVHSTPFLRIKVQTQNGSTTLDRTLDVSPSGSLNFNGFNIHGLHSVFASTSNAYDIGTNNIKWKTIYVTKISNGADIAVPTESGTLARVEDINAIGGDGTEGQVLTKTVDGMAWQDASGGDIDISHINNESVVTKDLTVGTDEGTLNIGVVAGVATIATNNGLDIVAQTKFDTAPTTDDNTTYANALDTSLVRKAQVATAISSMANDILGTVATDYITLGTAEERFVARNQGAGNAGKVLMVDSSGSVIANDVPATGTTITIKRYN